MPKFPDSKKDLNLLTTAWHVRTNIKMYTQESLILSATFGLSDETSEPANVCLYIFRALSSRLLSSNPDASMEMSIDAGFLFWKYWKCFIIVHFYFLMVLHGPGNILVVGELARGNNTLSFFPFLHTHSVRIFVKFRGLMLPLHIRSTKHETVYKKDPH